MRTFMAIETPQEISDKVVYVQERLKEAGFYGNWPIAHNVHLTLFFFGEIDKVKVKNIAKIMDKTAARIKEFKLTAYGTGVFPLKGLPRVVWLGCDGEKMQFLYKTLNDFLKERGFNFGNEFIPHITVGRIKGVPKNWRKKISDVEYEPVSFMCNSIDLISSKLTPHGSIYTTIHKSKLGGLKI